ncbi:hypothetical protein DYB25_000833 [Aphanomyces astaci]|uniref:Ubiquitin-like domain-containing protein n=1 Tax=Aphanomyces astaci TaxID=112090 RepID=A0A397FDE9_APHAT|nr:hypothetical protein DYB25_000833 [Aphanomyces astaci]RHY08174.1 hypothetical protein DYB36_002002 [Aphanomyces astaci]RHY54806.1 hypothetical protein DYB30_002658 [Aphanomyces astaci]RHZ21100.1 hypothetical protein DYB31_003411 [Aphanomyces astaci]
MASGGESSNPSQGNSSEQGGPTSSVATTLGSGVVQMAIDVSEVAATGTAAPLIDLNVKTVDQRQFQINLLASSSVPQLKSKIELETGVVTDRQRLIFRGKVLKNENNLAHYALENGHTLHLVIRPADASPTVASSASSVTAPLREGDSASTSSRPARIISGLRPGESPSQSRSNDDPDPSLMHGDGSNQNGIPRVLATFAVPEGAQGMPFLQSLLSTIMNSVQGVSEGQPATTTGSAGTTNSPAASSIAPLRTDASGPSTRNIPMERVMLRANSNSRHDRAGRVNALLDSLMRGLDRPDSDFPPAIRDLTHASYEADVQVLRNNIETLVLLTADLQPRFERLSVALQELHVRRGNRALQMELVSPIFRTIEALQSSGDVAGLLARISRRLFLRYNGGPPAPEAPADLIASSLSQPGASSRSVQPFPSLLEARLPPTSTTPSTSSSSAGLLVDLQGQQYRRTDAFNAMVQGMREAATSSTASRTTEADNSSMFEFEARIPIIVFPTQESSSQQSPAAPPQRRWNFASFARRVMQTLSAGDVFGVLGGSRDALLSVIQHVGMHLIEGNDFPPMSPGTNRDWSVDMIAALRDHVDTLPRFHHPLLPPASPNLAGHIVQSVSPFAPELVVALIRGTNVEPANASSFLDSVCPFFGHMARQVVSDILAQLSDHPSALTSVLEDLLVHFGVARHIAVFVIQTFQTMPDVQHALRPTTPPRVASTRPRDDTADGDVPKRARLE